MLKGERIHLELNRHSDAELLQFRPGAVGYMAESQMTTADVLNTLLVERGLTDKHGALTPKGRTTLMQRLSG